MVGREQGTGNKEQGTPFLIVTGAGRSGTSAVARVLHESGLRMGTDLAPASHINPEGFYEDLGVVSVNERLLTDLGLTDPWSPERRPRRATVLAAAARYHDEMASLAAGGVDGWKDPRFSITLEAWLPLLPAAPKVVVCLRSPEAFVDSVIRVYGLVSRERATQKWAFHYRRLLAVIRDCRLDATCVEYDALVERPEETVAALSEFVGRELDAGYVDAPLRRFRGEVADRWRGLYERVLSLSRTNVVLPTRPPAEVIKIGGHSFDFAQDRPQTPGPSASLRAGAVAPPPSASSVQVLCTPRADDDASEKAIGPYMERIHTIDESVRAAKARWQALVGMPRPAVGAETRAASEAYETVLCEAQRELAQLAPPPELQRYHELARRQVDLERMAAHLLLSAVSGETLDRRALRAAVRAWRTLCSDEAVERAERERQATLERVRATVG